MTLGRTLCLLLASTVLAAPAFAQAPARDALPGSGGTERWRARHAEWEAGREARDRHRSTDIALLLRLKPDQQAALQALEASKRRPQGERRERDGDGDANRAPSTTTQALDRMQARMSEHEARMRARLDATRRFYASLTPEQQGLFDALMRLRRGGEGGHRHGPPMMRGEGPRMNDSMAPSPQPGV